MKILLLIFLTLSIGCGQTTNEKNKDKNNEATLALSFADYLRKLTPASTIADPTTDAGAAQLNAEAITAAKALPVLDISSAAPAVIQALTLKGVITSVDMSKGTPIVDFYVTTPTNRLKGFGWTTKTDGSYSSTTGVSTATATSYTTNLTAVSNINFSFAKLVAGTNGSPDKWVYYLTTSIPTPNGTNGTGTTAVARTAGWAKNSTDVNGTIVDNGDGSYRYTFARDITKSKDLIGFEYANSTITTALTATSAFKQASTGDLTYAPTLPHRMVVYIGSGTVRGTGTNNTDGTNQPVMSGGCSSKTACSGTAVASLNFTDGETVIYDFIPSTNTIKPTQRDIVNVSTCNNCHKSATATTTSGITTRGLIFHGAGGRNDVKHCVTCHTDQTKAQSTTGADQLSSNLSFGATGNGYLLDGEAVVDFPIMVHKFHMSSKLRKSGAGYYPGSANYPFPTKAAAFMTTASAKNCATCHTSNKSANNEDNWKNKPSRMACGACHDGLNFTTGSLASANTANTATSHAGGTATSDAGCATCHTPTNIASKHGQ